MLVLMRCVDKKSHSDRSRSTLDRQLCGRRCFLALQYGELIKNASAVKHSVRERDALCGIRADASPRQVSLTA